MEEFDMIRINGFTFQVTRCERWARRRDVRAGSVPFSLLWSRPSRMPGKTLQRTVTIFRLVNPPPLAWRRHAYKQPYQPIVNCFSFVRIVPDNPPNCMTILCKSAVLIRRRTIAHVRWVGASRGAKTWAWITHQMLCRFRSGRSRRCDGVSQSEGRRTWHREGVISEKARARQTR